MDPTGENLRERGRKKERNQCESAGGSPSQSAAMTARQMAAGQLGCQAISIIITHQARHGQRAEGRPLQARHAETPGNHQMFVSLSARVTFIYLV